MKDYKPIIVDRWPDSYFEKRNLNDPKRIKQFELDCVLIKKYIKSGKVCDVGCSTGEFLEFIDFEGELYGMEVNENAQKRAEMRSISFEKNIINQTEFFDLVIFRGTIQHVDEPFMMMKKSFQSLKKGGFVIFLATPNSNSILYKFKKDLPFLDWPINFYIPGKKELTNALKNIGFSIEEVSYPYFKTPYRNLIKDHLLFILNLITPKFYPHAFWKSSMNIVCKKPEK